MSKVTAYYHIVFCTKAREMTIPLPLRNDVYRFIWAETKKMQCELIRIGGIQNHIHMLVNLHPTIALSAFMQNIKGRTSSWMGRDPRFKLFKGWAKDYYAYTISPEAKPVVIDYIKKQDSHHLGSDFDTELIELHHLAEAEYTGLTMRD